MSGAPGTPQDFYVQTANQQTLVSWSLTPGATSYVIQRSLDDVTYTTLATVSGSPLATSYLDTTPILGVKYFYKVAAANTSGTSPYTASGGATPTPTGEMTLGQIRLAAQQRADRVGSKFVTTPEWRNYINQSMFELYDLLVTTYEDYFLATPVSFTADGASSMFPLPNGSNTFTNANTGTTFTPPAFYKLSGVDLAANNTPNTYVTIHKFNFVDRNKYVYPNLSGPIYGVFDLKYRVMGNNIEFMPIPTSGQTVRLWYIPRLTELLQDTDTTTVGISGWIEYVIVKAAYYALTKEESDTSSLVMQLAALQKRIEESAANRDAGMPDTISNTRRTGFDDGFGNGFSGAF